MRRPLRRLALPREASLLLGLLAGCAPRVPAEPAPSEPREELALRDFPALTEPSPHFVVDGKPFCFAGANNYYLTYQNPSAVLRVLESAKAMQLGVLRLWGFLDRGALDGSVRNVHGSGEKDGVYFQYWDPKTERPAYNDGPNGLARLDFVLHHARRLGLKVIIALTNNWRDFGGMDQYLVWRGLRQHHQFFTDPEVRNDFKDWATHLLSRENSLDGTLYREDPAVFAWELANEPRTITGQDFDSPTGWDTSTITTWAAEMSAHLKSLDPNHMISVGDEGFLGGGNAWGYDSPYGIDHERLTALTSVDFGTFHLYPDHFKTPIAWGNDWIEAHTEVARRVGKPTLLEEYGVVVRRSEGTKGDVVGGRERRNVAYRNYNQGMLARGGAGALFWHLAGETAPGSLYPDYDHFTVYPGDETARLLETFAKAYPTEAVACSVSPEVQTAPSAFVRATKGYER